MTPRLAFLALVPALWGPTACSPKIQDEYEVEIVGALNQKYLAGATSGVLEVNDKVVATARITPGAPFSLTGTGIDVSAETTAVFRFKALDARGAVVFHGQSPRVELALASPPVVRVFIQNPGSFGRSFDLDYPRRDMIVAVAPSTVAVDRAQKVDVAYFGLGEVVVPEAPDRTTSDELRIFNPITQIIGNGGTSSTINGQRQPRKGAAAAVKNDGSILIFGGELAATGTTPATASGQLDMVRVARIAFDVFSSDLKTKNSDTPGVPRRGAAMVQTDAAYAFGGRAGDVVLDTVLAIDPDKDPAFKILAARMAGPREGHTATVVNLPGNGQEILVFGGAPADKAVAEVLDAAKNFVPVVGNAGPPRRGHAALLLPTRDQVIILGGQSDAGVLGDSVIYNAVDRSVSPGRITLKRARRDFSAFIVGDDLVVVGGFDADGNLVATGEIYHASTFEPRNLDVPAVPRAGASVAVLSNQQVLILGGTQAADKMPGVLTASSVVEIYQPLVLK